MNNTDFISLTSLYVLAAQLYYVICNNGGAVEYSQLERLYGEYYRKPMKLSTFNINSVNEFYNRFNLMFYVRGSKKKSVVVLNKNLQGKRSNYFTKRYFYIHVSEHIAFKYDNNDVEIPMDQLRENQWNQTLPAAADTSQGAVKKYSPPKPDTPPTPVGNQR